MNIQQLQSLKILVLGDSCYDKYHFGEITRLSPEAPVPVFDLVSTDERPGMASNVVKNLDSLGAQTRFLTNSEVLTKERYVDIRSGQQLIRVDKGSTVAPLDESIFQETSLNEYDAVVISDYNKGFLSEHVVKFLLKTYKGPVFVDSKKKDLSHYEKCFIKINESEFDNLKAIPPNCELIVTLGPKGARYKDTTYPTKKVEVFDVCGAGDTFFAAFVCAYLIEKNIIKSIKFANKCASITVQKLGTYAPSLEEVKNDICI